MSSNDTQYTFNGAPDVLSKSVTTSITGATFTDGATLSGTWTANYDSSGNLLDQVTGTFTVTGPAGTATFTAAGTLPYANTAGASSYEIHFLSSSGTGYSSLYVDWKGETPDALALGTPSLYTSVAGTDASQPLRLTSGGSPGATATCFLAGTRLLTPDGEVAIESLSAGDAVSVMRDGTLVTEHIRWVGSRSVDATSGIVPVRIRAGAFDVGVPHADLLVTPEHSILVDGGLIPVRMLVNGGSIVADHDRTRFTFHHVELDRHGILMAEGLPTESYLDTGNKRTFSSEDIVAIKPVFPVEDVPATWQNDACAPLTTDRDTVEPIWARLARRAVSIGFGPNTTLVALVDDPLLRLRLDDGCELNAWVRHPDRVVFWVPEGRAPMILLSRSARPDEAIGPFVDDRRRLGVKVATLSYGEALDAEPVALAALNQTGWHAMEVDGRWTDGAAALDLPPALNGTTMLSVELRRTMRYPVALPTRGVAA